MNKAYRWHLFLSASKSCSAIPVPLIWIGAMMQ
jgi:hypothetical protein